MRRRINPNLIGNILELEERTSRVEAIMRIIGYSPEKPYTLTVNDGTRNRVEIGLIDGVYGIKIVDNAGGEVILANGSINADAITVGTLDAGVITVTNIDADSITTGTLEADFIVGGTLDYSTMTVQSLNAGSITVGSFININDRLNAQAIHGDKITADTLNANRIVAGSITSNEIQSHSISGDVIAFGTLTGDHLNVRTITADRIKTNSITTTEINYVSGSKLTFESVTYDKIAAHTITADQIASNTLSTSELNFITGDANSLSVSGLTSTYLDAGNGGVSPSTPGFIVWPDGCSFTSSGNNGIYYHTGFNNYDIYDIRDGYANNWYNRCEVAEGIDPFEVMESFEAEDEEKSSSKKWKKINHGKLHPSIYKKTKVKRTILEEGKLVESETEVEAYSLNKLVEFQRQAILQLKQEIENLKKAPNV